MMKRTLIDTERKTPAENIKTCLHTLCSTFTVYTLILLVLGTIYADAEAQRGIGYCWSLFGACVLATVLQFVFFTPTVIKHMSYALRTTAFGICLYAGLVAIAVTMQWFPVALTGAWILFTVIYLAIFAVIGAVFAIKHKREERELNEQLAAYRSKQQK